MGDVVFVLMDLFVGFGGVIDVQCDMVVGGVQFIVVYVLVVGQFDYCGFVFFVVVDKGEGVFVFWVFVGVQQFYV